MATNFAFCDRSSIRVGEYTLALVWLSSDMLGNVIAGWAIGQGGIRGTKIGWPST